MVDTGPPKAAAAEIVPGSGTVLLIDDEEVVRQLALLTLANLGYEVLLAKYGREALNVLDEHRGEINLVITDLLMPGLSGNELITRLRDAAAGIAAPCAAARSTRGPRKRTRRRDGGREGGGGESVMGGGWNTRSSSSTPNREVVAECGASPPAVDSW